MTVATKPGVLLIGDIGEDAEGAATELTDAARSAGHTVLRLWLPSGRDADDPIHDRLWEQARLEALALLSGLRESTGVAPLAAGLGLGGLMALELALDGRVAGAVAWEPDLGLPNRLDAAWHADRGAFVDERGVWHGTYAAVQPLRVALTGLRGRALPVPGLVVGEVTARRAVDPRWFGDLRHRHAFVQVNCQGSDAVADDAGWTRQDTLSTVLDWLSHVPAITLPSPGRTDGRLVDPSASPREGRGSIFISYRHGGDGEPRALRIFDYLQAAGFRAWLDRYSTTPDDIVSIVDRVITEDCSGGVLVLSEDVTASNFIKRQEVTRLLAHAARHDVRIAVDNAIRLSEDSTRIDPRAPLTQLGLDEGSLDNFVQYDLASSKDEPNYGMGKFLRDLLAARFAELRNQVVVLDVHTYPALENDLPDNTAADLRFRVPLPMGAGRHAERQDALARLAFALPLVGRALHASGPERVVVTGGGHNPVALALGGVLAVTRVQCPVVVQGRGRQVWGLPDAEGDDPHLHVLSAPTGHVLDRPDSTSRRVAVLVRGSETNPKLFDELLAGLSTTIAGAVTLTYERAEGKPPASGGHPDFIDPREGIRMAGEFATAIHAFAAAHGADEVLLCYALNFELAVLLGQRLNKLRIVTYDLIDKAWYRRILALDRIDAQIETVFPDDPPAPATKPDSYL